MGDKCTVTSDDDFNGWGFSTAAGYEWRLTHKFAMGLEIEYAYIDVGGSFASANWFVGSWQFNWYW